MKQDFEIWMIRVKDDPVSEAYANYCLESWKGFEVNLFDAVTPATVHLYDDELTFSFKGHNSGNPVAFSETEKACFLSQYLLWKKCWENDVPILVLEHDAWCLDPEPIIYDKRFMVSYFGQLAAEAIMFTPDFVDILLTEKLRRPITYGPFTLIDRTVLKSLKAQAYHALPHARFLGPMAPVRQVMDFKVGNCISHGGRIGLGTAQKYIDKKEDDNFISINLGLDASLAKTEG